MATAYCINASWAQEYASPYDLSASWAQNYGHEDLVASWAQEYQGDHDLLASWAHKYMAEEVYAFAITQPPTATISPGYGGPSISVNNHFSYGYDVQSNGVSFSAYNLPDAGPTNIMKDLVVQQQRGQPARMKFECWDPESIFGPFSSAASVFDIDTHTTTTVNRTFKPIFQVGSSVWNQAPEFLVVSNPWRLGSDGQQYVGVECVDFSQFLLEDEDFSYGSFNSESGNIWMASQIINEILLSKGISSRLEIRDYPVVRFAAVGGSPLEHVKALLYFAQAEWWFEGRTFCAQSAGYGGSLWTFEDIYTIDDFEYTRSRLGVFNELIVNKEEVQSGILVDQRCSGRHCLGFQTARWETGVNTAIAYVKDIVNGSVDSWVWRDVNGVPIVDSPTTSSAGPRVLSTKPVHEVQFIYRPRFGILGSGDHFGPGGSGTAWTPNMIPAYHLQILGRSAFDDSAFGDFTKKLNVQKIDTVSQLRLGRKLGSTINTSVIGRREDVDYLLEQIVAESLRHENTVSLRLNVNQPWVQPGDTVTLKIGRAGMASGKTFLVQQVTKDATGQMKMVLLRSNTMN